MRERYRHPARISPDTENLHHHHWEHLEERGEESRGLRKKKKAEGKTGRGERGVRDREGSTGRGTRCRETKKTNGEKKTVRVKAEARFTSPRIPTSFYRP